MTDARFSGVSTGACIGHVTPEALAGQRIGHTVVYHPETASTNDEVRTLADGSVVELNKGAEIAVDFSGAERHIRLLRGEAHFTVEPDPSRPFVVSVAGRFPDRVRAGAAFCPTGMVGTPPKCC